MTSLLNNFCTCIGTPDFSPGFVIITNEKYFRLARKKSKHRCDICK